jgi:hypothetical protein
MERQPEQEENAGLRAVGFVGRVIGMAAAWSLFLVALAALAAPAVALIYFGWLPHGPLGIVVVAAALIVAWLILGHLWRRFRSS